ncbi:MAG: decaprenyl-phosphate phosphoribosyltransferase [Anaerolineaceae bacterium]|jgi:4-hydroxybenzoate polyprenyltransferase|nr:decaprenyl-phosphate phosphoribosyltransferase [Anaerolineaceae bacterium]OQY89754.1 MAG: decaprenyl-phosphate phosphoribosyltransferase [Anaerolineae bacterium UTCFX1]
MFSALLKTMRLRQWTKNGFVFFALIFDKQLFLRESFLRTLAGFFLFCLISSAVYLFNDISDMEADRKHPEKKHRPVASGELSVGAAWGAALALALISLSLGYLLAPLFSAFLAAYLIINIVYSRWLKHVPILDVLFVSSGFVLRVGAGVTLITVERFSPWLYVITTLFSLYLGFGKRRAEISLLEESAGSHRKVLDGYTLPLLDQFITIVSGMTIVTYALYTFFAENLPANHSMMLTIPFVVYGIFRYLQLIQTGHAAGAPDEVALKDRPLQITVVLWMLTVLVIFYLS